MIVCANSNQPWNSTLVLLPKCKTLMDVNQIHARIITTGLINNSYLTTKLILSFSSSPHTPLIQFARCLFLSQHSHTNFGNQQEEEEEEDPFLWNAIIKSFSHGDEPNGAFLVFSLMLECGVFADKYSFSLALKACSRLGLIKEGMQIHGLMSKFVIGFDGFLQNCLVMFYVRCGCIELARQVFDRMLKRDSVSFNSLIDGYVKCGMVNSAREVFDFMPVELKNLITWNSLISGYAKSENGFKIAWELFETMPERDLVSWNLMIDGAVKCGKMKIAHALFNRMPERDEFTWASMIDGYAKLGSVNTSRSLFVEMPEGDVISSNAMMAGYVQNGCCVEALKLFHDMLSHSKLCPDNTTLLIALSAIAQLGHIDEGIAIHCYIEENGFAFGGKLGVSLIDMYSKCGSIEKAIRVFRDIEEKNVDHCNAMIYGLGIHGLGELAFELFVGMERISVKPDDITFIAVLNACGHAGLVKEGLLCFELMRRTYKLEPKIHHYGCLVDILGRAGHTEAARNFVEEMPIEPNDVIWRTLLSACQNYGKLDIGEPVTNHIISLGIYNSSSCVLLSNMYAGLGMWEDVRRVRTLMKERDLKKIPGCSWIELEGIVHEFFAGNESHPHVREVYSMLDRTTLTSEVTYCQP